MMVALIDRKFNVVYWLSHQRLSIVDLTSAGNQPMESTSKRYVLIYNGEIYNHIELRKTNIEIKPIKLARRLYSDT